MSNKFESEEFKTLCQMKGIIESLPNEKQSKINYYADQFRNIVKSDEESGLIALGLVSMEINFESLK